MEQIEIKDPYGFIYITTNMVNGKRYIGQKKFLKSKWKNYIGSGYYFLKAVKKYGKENFIRDIVDIAYSLEELNQKEKLWIENYKAVESEDYYNVIEGGNTGSHLNHDNMISCICIDNGMIFNSLSDASNWSNYSVTKVKGSFKKIHSFDYKNEGYIFRLLSSVDHNKPICCICGKNYRKSKNNSSMCNKCFENVNLPRCIYCKEIIEQTNKKQKMCDRCKSIRKKTMTKLQSEKAKYKRKGIDKNLSKFEKEEIVKKEIAIEIKREKVKLTKSKRKIIK